MSAGDNELPLYRFMFHPEHPNLFFIGFVQPLGAIMPIAERQATLIGESLRGRFELPSRAVMEADIAKVRRKMRRRYVASKRHTIQVDYDDYMKALGRELESGRDRADAAAAPAG